MLNFTVTMDSSFSATKVTVIHIIEVNIPLLMAQPKCKSLFLFTRQMIDLDASKSANVTFLVPLSNGTTGTASVQMGLR